MVHKASIIPALSEFLDNAVLAQYPPTAMKRIVAAGAIALFLNQNSNMVDNIINNPLIAGLGVSTSDGLIDIDTLYDIYKKEIAKAGYMRVNFPLLGDVDFTVDDLTSLYNILNRNKVEARS